MKNNQTYSKEKESLDIRPEGEIISNMIFDLTSSYIFIVSEDFKIIDINRSALEVLDLKKQDLIGQYIGHYMGMDDYIDVLYENSRIVSRETKWAERDRMLVGDLFHLSGKKAIVAIYRDITKLEEERNVIKEIRESTRKVAQTLIDRQMEVTREIASLLGESTAETKIILGRLKDIGGKDE